MLCHHVLLETKHKCRINIPSMWRLHPHSGMCQNRCKINERWRTEGKQIPYLAWHYLLTLRMIISINRLSKPQVGCGKNKGFNCHPFQMLTRRCWCTCHSGANNVITRIGIRAFNCAEAMSNPCLRPPPRGKNKLIELAINIQLNSYKKSKGGKSEKQNKKKQINICPFHSTACEIRLWVNSLAANRDKTKHKAASGGICIITVGHLSSRPPLRREMCDNIWQESKHASPAE